MNIWKVICNADIFLFCIFAQSKIKYLLPPFKNERVFLWSSKVPNPLHFFSSFCLFARRWSYWIVGSVKWSPKFNMISKQHFWKKRPISEKWGMLMNGSKFLPSFIYFADSLVTHCVWLLYWLYGAPNPVWSLRKFDSWYYISEK